MNKNTLIIVGVIVVLGLAFVFMNQSPRVAVDSDNGANGAMLAGEPNSDNGLIGGDAVDPNMDGSGSLSQRTKYFPYVKQSFEAAASDRRVLFFYANWCPTCKSAETSFMQNLGNFPGDISLIRVNYNDTETDVEERALAQKYGVTYQHTFVQIDAKGEVVQKWNGGGYDDLIERVK